MTRRLPHTLPVAVAGVVCIGLSAAAYLDGAAAVGGGSMTLEPTRLVIPAGPDAQVDGRCGEYSSANAAMVTLSSTSGPQVYLRTAGASLLICFEDLLLTDNAQNQLPFAAVYVDGDHSGGSAPSVQDFRLRITLDAEDPLLERGDGSGGWQAVTATGWEVASVGAICGRALCADAEFRVPASMISGWNGLWGMLLAHHWLTAPGDDRVWPWTPPAGLPLVPGTWAEAHREGVTPPTPTTPPLTGTAPTPTQTVRTTATVAPTATPSPTSTRLAATPTETPIPTALPPVEAGLALVPSTGYANGVVTARGANYECGSPGIDLRWEGRLLMARANSDPLNLRVPIPPHIEPGRYEVTAQCADGSGRRASAAVSIIDPPPAPNAAMLASAGPFYVAQPVVLLDRSTGPVVRRDWDFGDGSPLAHRQDGVHRWAVGGSYTVTLTVYDPIGRTDAQHRTIDVRDPVATGQLTLQPDGRTVDFVDLSEGPFTTRRWEFGDGHTSDRESVSHRYGQPGTYMPRLVLGYPGAGGVVETRTAELGPFVIGPSDADNLAVVGLNLVQANLGDRRLAARRRTLAWVTVRRTGRLADDGIPEPLARLQAAHLDGAPLPGTPVLRDRRRLPDDRPGSLSDTFVFELPLAWTLEQTRDATDPILGQLEVASPIVLSADALAHYGGETTTADNSLAREFLFTSTEPVDLLAVPLRGPDGLAVENGDLTALYRRLSRALPVAEGGLRVWWPAGGNAVEVPADRAVGTGAALEAARQALLQGGAARTFRGVALTVDHAGTPGAECAAASAGAGRGIWVADRQAEWPMGPRRTAIALIQALAGSFGLGLTPDAPADSGIVDPSYPVADGHLDEDGIDVDTLREWRRGETVDYMSPSACASGRTWWSAHNYGRLVDRLAATSGGRIGSKGRTSAAVTVVPRDEEPPPYHDYALISGIVRPPGTAGPRVTIDPIFHQPVRTSSRDDAPGSGEWAIAFQAEDGTPLFTRFMEIRFYRDPDGVMQPSAFLEVVPWSPYTRHIFLRHGTETLWSQDVPPGWPSVTVLEPIVDEHWEQGKTYRVAWQADDPAGLPLSYQVEISTYVGHGWRTVGATLGETELALESAYLPGCDECRLRVRASNGVLMGAGMSPAFSIEPPAPIVEILAPTDGAVFPAGDPIWLMGIAYDHTDGPLGAGQVSWSSDLDGGLGLSPTVQTVLSAGRHTIRLRAINSYGLSASTSIALRVASSRRAFEVFLPYAGLTPTTSPTALMLQSVGSR